MALGGSYLSELGSGDHPAPRRLPVVEAHAELCGCSVPSECACGGCSQMCTRPCWPTPEEARRLIRAGLGDRLMLDYWGGVVSMVGTFMFLLLL